MNSIDKPEVNTIYENREQRTSAFWFSEEKNMQVTHKLLIFSVYGLARHLLYIPV